MNDNEQRHSKEPWEPNYYETGDTRPPKKRSGCLMLLMALVIFLGGIVTAFGMFKVKDATQNRQTALLGFEPEVSATTEPAESTPQPTSESDVRLELSGSPQAPDNVTQAGGMALQDIYTKVIDSVVSISCNTGTGTGVVVSENGYIVTNFHVVEGASVIQVLLNDASTFSARLIGSDAFSDLAVLHIEAQGLTAAEFGDSEAVRVGDAVVAIGDPLGIGLRGTMTDGIISAINRDITTGGRTMNLLQTNAALNNGNSGGPLINCYGQVIGINTIKIGDSMNVNGVEGLGFAIPSVTVKEVVDQLMSQGYVSGRPTLGITGQALSSFDILYYRLPKGIYITDVTDDSDAAAKGIAPGDILLQFNDTRITSAEDLQNALYGCNAGDVVQLVLYRSGQQYGVSVVLDEAKE